MIRFEFRAHPMMFFKIIKPYLFVLILPFIRAFVQYVTKGYTSGTILLEFVAIVFISVLAFCGWKNIKIGIKNKKITVEKGFFIKSEAVIDTQCVSSISIKQNVIDLLTGCVTCFINTEAGGLKKNDFEIKMYKNDAKILAFLVYGSENVKKVKFSFLKIALLAASTSSVFTGLIIGIPIINKTEDIVNVTISDSFLKSINAFTSDFADFFPAVFNFITIIFISAYSVSFLFSLLKKINFKINIGKDIIKVQSGLIYNKQIIFRKKSINDICFEQTAFMRLLKKHSMRASIAGYGDNKGESATIAPLVSKNSFKKHLKPYFSFLNVENAVIAPKRDIKTYNRFLFIPMIVFAAIIGAVVFIVIWLPQFSDLTWFLAFIALSFDLYYASVCYHNYKNSWFYPDKTIAVSGSTQFKIRELYCDKSRVGIIKISQTPADKRFNTCKLNIIVRSESADSIKVKNIGLKATIDSINQIYNTNISV